MSMIREALTNDILERYDNEEYWDEEVGIEAAREVIALPYGDFVDEVMKMTPFEINLLLRVLERESNNVKDCNKKINYLKNSII